MLTCYITFRSITYAQRGENLLRQAGIPCRLSRTPRWMEEQGCGYSLRLRCRDMEGAAELLRAGGVPFRKLYAVRPDGKMEEQRL